MGRGSAVLLMLSELADAMSSAAFMAPYAMSKFALEVRCTHNADDAVLAGP
jgi:hypothetical protein